MAPVGDAMDTTPPPAVDDAMDITLEGVGRPAPPESSPPPAVAMDLSALPKGVMDSSAVTLENFESIFKPLIFYYNGKEISGTNILKEIEDSKVHNRTPHHNETLYEHLCRAGEESHNYAVANGLWSPSSPWLYFVTGFVHDIGKTAMSDMKGHAIVGAANLDAWLMTPSFLEAFHLTDTDAKLVIAVTNIHMYLHRPSNAELLQYIYSETPDALKLMEAVNYGDSQAKKPVGQQSMRGLSDVQSQPSSDNLFPTSSVGVLINCMGKSGAGKTTCAELIKEMLIDEYEVTPVHIKRDQVLCDVVKEDLEQKNVEITEEERSNSRYVHEYLAENEHLRKRVDNRINTAVNTNLAFGNVVILDTMATMHSKHRNKLINNNGNGYFILDVWMHRDESTYNDIESMQHIGMNQEEHKKLNSKNGEFTKWCVLGSKQNWYCLSSAKETFQPQTKTGKNNTAPTLTLPCTHSSQFGLANMKIVLRKVMQARQDKIRKIEQSSRVKYITDCNRANEWSLENLVKYLMRLDHSGDLMLNFFKDLNFTATVLKKEDAPIALVCIKYIYGLNTMFLPRWAREARGAGFAIDTNTGNCVMIKEGLERTVEVLTQSHVNNGVQYSQDMTSATDLSGFPKKYVEAINKINQKSITDKDEYVLVDKVDGCLITLSCHHKDSEAYKILNNFLQHFDSTEFWRIQYNDWLIIPASSGSVQIKDFMRETLLSSLEKIWPSNSHEYDDENLWLNLNKTLADCIVSSLKPGTSQHLQCEAVCRKRETLRGHCHRELAISYDRPGLFLLGISHNGTFTPRHKLHSFGNTSSQVFDYPQFYRIEDWESFNTLSSRNQNHPEGYMFMTTDATLKLKSADYYIAHRVGSDISNIFAALKNSILTLPMRTELSPDIARMLYDNKQKIYPELNTIQLLISPSYAYIIKDAYTEVVDFLNGLGQEAFNASGNYTVYAKKVANGDTDIVKYALDKSNPVAQQNALNVFGAKFDVSIPNTPKNRSSLIQCVQCLVKRNEVVVDRTLHNLLTGKDATD